MNNKQKKEIRNQVILGIFQWIGYVIVGIMALVIIALPFILAYQAGEANGYNQGWEEANNNIHEILEEHSTVRIPNLEGGLVTLQEYHS